MVASYDFWVNDQTGPNCIFISLWRAKNTDFSSFATSASRGIPSSFVLPTACGKQGLLVTANFVSKWHFGCYDFWKHTIGARWTWAKAM
jgi:hypothetical protein